MGRINHVRLARVIVHHAWTASHQLSFLSKEAYRSTHLDGDGSRLEGRTKEPHPTVAPFSWKSRISACSAKCPRARITPERVSSIRCQRQPATVGCSA